MVAAKDGIYIFGGNGVLSFDNNLHSFNTISAEWLAIGSSLSGM